MPRQATREDPGSAQAGIQGGSRQCPGRHPGRTQAVPRQGSREAPGSAQSHISSFCVPRLHINGLLLDHTAMVCSASDFGLKGQARSHHVAR